MNRHADAVDDRDAPAHLDARLIENIQHSLHPLDELHLSVGDCLEAGNSSNFGSGQTANFIYLTATLDAAVWGAELAQGDAPGRIYLVSPTGPFSTSGAPKRVSARWA